MSLSDQLSTQLKVPGGLILRTLTDAGHYIDKLPVTTRAKPEWRDAASAVSFAKEWPEWIPAATRALRFAIDGPDG